ncbi:hypothetical protein DERF_011433 [Dermatophagoides farinae]|uniref:Uncharacterized protein n=1 Tax=Dermatophagoides farinae TaxID=6954 RepID=A0A922HT19_DERFA|nr:hypothetical protein DERF_011433 [Dermatophagoides farinae]
MDHKIFVRFLFDNNNNNNINVKCINFGILFTQTEKKVTKSLNLIYFIVILINLGKRRPGTEKKQRKMTATNEN